MASIFQFYKQLPTWLKYVVIWLCICLPLTFLSSQLPQGLFVVVITGVSAFFAAFYLFQRLIELYEKTQGSKLDKEITEQTSGPSRLEVAEKEKEYKTKWNEGLKKLEKSKISIYQLPWYLIIGEPGGGKTMTLLSSGMDFPLGKEELSGFGGTRNYNWWFTNSAVILDTAGRLVFEQEGTTDRQEWEAFLKLLKKRRRCPINGVIVALPADKLMSDSAEQRHASANIIRDRLRQVQAVLDVRFPVFLLITKADLVAGFTEFYNDLSSLQRNQLFGWSRPGEFDATFDPREFDADFEQLYHRLHALRLQFLARQSSDIEAGWIYTFPEAFRGLRERIRDYVDVMFSKNIFAEPLFFRGFYFTSALQEGKPILDILGEHLSGEDLESLEGIFPQSRAFFIHDFYTQKVAKEQGMVFRSQKHIKRMRLLKHSTLYLGLPLLFVFALLTGLGFRAYRATVDGPRQVVVAAGELIGKYQQQRDNNEVWNIAAPDHEEIVRAIELAQLLDEAIEQVKHPGGLASIMFASIGSDAESSIRAIQRELIGTCILRPQVARVEQVLAGNEESITPGNIENFSASLATYIQWHWGEEQRGKAEFEALQGVLTDSENEQKALGSLIARFAEGGPESGAARFSPALTGDLTHRRQVIMRAFDKAHAYWLASTDIENHPSFAWWSTLLARCQEVEESYRALCQFGRNFENARRPESFRKAAQDWLKTFPQSNIAGASSSPNTKLLQPLREHLIDAPIERGQVAQLDSIIRQVQNRHAEFWKVCQTAIGRASSDQDKEFADELTSKLEAFGSEFREKMQAGGNVYVPRMAQVDRILERRSSQQLTFVKPAEQAERILEGLARSLDQVAGGVDAHVESWSNRFNELMDEQQDVPNIDIDKNWQPADLKKLAGAISTSRRRFELQSMTETITKWLNPLPPQGLAKYMEGEDEPAVTLQFAGLKNRHDAAFLLNTALANQSLRRTLAKAVDRGLLPDSADLENYLSRAMQQYLQHYLESWSAAYGEYRLAPLVDYDLPSRWDEYRRWLQNHGKNLRKDYEEHFDSLTRNTVRLFQPSAERHTEVKEELRRQLSQIDWPRRSRLKPLIERAVDAGALPNAEQVLAGWRKFNYQVEDFRFDRLDRLTDNPLVFTRLGGGQGQEHVLADEWLTSQLQYLVDYGQWLLWSDIQRKLNEEHFKPLAGVKPFIFKGGSFEDSERLKLEALLKTISAVHEFAGRQAASGPFVQEWLPAASAWAAFLTREHIEISLQYDQKIDPDFSPITYYGKLALRLPGLTSASGDALTEVVFSVSQQSPPATYRWRPQQGRVEVALRDMTARTKSLNAELEPRLCQLPSSEFGLIQFIRSHGTPVDEQSNEWLIKLTKKISEIQGFANEQTDQATISITLRIKLLDPARALPPLIDWPDFSEMSNARPNPPWRLPADDS